MDVSRSQSLPEQLPPDWISPDEFQLAWHPAEEDIQGYLHGQKSKWKLLEEAWVEEMILKT